MSKRTDYIKQLFKQTRLLESEKFEADNLDKIKLVYVNDVVMVENEHGTTYELEYLSDQEMDIISDNLECVEQYVFEELYYVKEKQTYDDGSPNGLVDIRVYMVEDNKPLKFGRTLVIDSDVIVSDEIYEVMQEEGYYMGDIEFIEL
jgi:hypothetical protein